jgi:hypothetical protein
MIPKIIHYCWFGEMAMPDSARNYIEGWLKKCPDFEFVKWDETNFDVNQSIYTREAYEKQKWAFISDYVRIYAIYTLGGIYMDTDIELLKPLNRFLSHSAFSGFEDDTTISTGIIGGCAKAKWIELIFNYYQNRKFLQPDGQMDLTTNVQTITRITVENYGMKLNNTYQELRDGLVVYPKDYFCPKSYKTGIVELSANSHCIHHFDSSWISKDRRRYKELSYIIIRFFGLAIGGRMLKVFYLVLLIKEEGIHKVMQRVVNRLRYPK